MNVLSKSYILKYDHMTKKHFGNPTRYHGEDIG